MGRTRPILASAARLTCVTLVAVSVLSLSTRAAPHRSSILVVFVDDSSQSWVHDMSDGISRVAFRQGATAPILYYEYLDTVRFEESDRRARQRAILKEKYRDRPLDLVVAIAPSAVAFVNESRDELWPGIPVLLTSYSGPIPQAMAARPKSAGVMFEWGFDRSLVVMKSVVPDMARVAIVGGGGEVERIRQSRNIRAVLDAGLEAIELVGLSTAETLRQVAALPDRSVVFIAGGQVDDDGNVVPTWPLCELVSTAANRPTFMLGAQFLGCGMVGGLMRDFVKIGTVIGERAMASLAVQPHGIEMVSFATVSTLAFDARQLERWHIPEARLPAGSEIRFRSDSLWRDHRALVLSVIAVGLVQLGLIVALLYHRRARQLAELRVRHHLSISAHVDRRLAMGELAEAMAHELKQPLGAIRLNVNAADRLLASGRASVNEVRDILRDVERDDGRATEIIERQRAMLQRHEIERAAIDVNDIVQEAVATVAHHASGNRVQVEMDLAVRSCAATGDRILLQQVIVNLVMNAIDAMGATPSPDRRIVVSTIRTAHGVDVAVQDRGEGISPQLFARIFEPFVSSKATGMGIGLTIVRGIVEAHGGTVQAKNNRGRGATFSFTLPGAEVEKAS